MYTYHHFISIYLFLVGAPSVDPDPESCLEAIGLLGALIPTKYVLRIPNIYSLPVYVSCGLVRPHFIGATARIFIRERDLSEMSPSRGPRTSLGLVGAPYHTHTTS